MVANLEAAKRWWDAQPESFKKATTRPGSVKCKSVNSGYLPLLTDLHLTEPGRVVAFLNDSG